jgi:acylphosphatase
VEVDGTPEADRRCVTVRIAGHVQGVGFRDWTLRQARKLAIEGWVRNEPDGSVRAVIAGSEAAISAMLDAFMHGPDFATVSDVIWELASDEGISGFEIVS